MSSTLASTTQDELLSFQEELDFNSFLLQHVFDGSTEALDQSRARIVGQEKDGSILFAWNACESTPSQESVSHIGLYSPPSPSYRVLHKHTEVRDICDASVSPDRSLLAFTVRERESAWMFTYDTLVAEIQPEGRVFSLNLSSGDFRKVQFIYPSSSSGRHTKQLPQPRLLVIIPEHWVCLYSFQMVAIERGYVTLTQPEHIILTKDFPWYQWDSERQWLYYARFEMLQTSSVNPQSSLVLYCIGLGGGGTSSSGSSHQVILTISLQVPYRQQHYLGVATYYESPLAFSIPVRELNMQVLHNKTGLWCVCLQHKDGRPPTQPQSRNPQIRFVEPPEAKLEYSVYLIHNGHVLEGQVILPGMVSTGHLLQFMLIGCFVVAYVPGVCLNILNVGPHTDPCHHLILEAKDSPMLPRATLGSVPPASVPPAAALQPQQAGFPSPSQDHAILSPTISWMKLSDFSTSVFHSATSVFYTCTLNPSGFMQLFMRTSDQKQQQSLLHLMLVGFRLYVDALKMVEHICQTPMTLADSQIFSEFIVAFSYSNMVPDSREYILHQIPLTTAMIFRGDVYKKEDGSNYALLKCNEIQDFVKQLLVQSDQRLVSASNDTIYSFVPNPNDAFDILCYTNVLSQQTRRINLEDMAARIPTEQLASPPQQASGPNRRKSVKQRVDRPSVSETSLVGRITRLIQSPRSASSHDFLPELPSFLKRDDELDQELLSHATRMREYIIQVMAVGVKHNHRAVIAAGENYWAELQRSSLILLRIIWQSLGFTDANSPLLLSIHRSPLPQEQALLELLEAYYIAHSDLGIPVPSGFATLFISVGYLCLEPSVFLQYMRNGVFTPTKKFLQLLFKECSEVDPEYLFEIVAFLEEDLAEMARMLWNNPILEQFLARRQHVT